jgi:hypothetical protein
MWQTFGKTAKSRSERIQGDPKNTLRHVFLYPGVFAFDLGERRFCDTITMF